MTRNQRIKHALRVSGVSQEKLADALGITQAAVGKQLNKAEEIDSMNFLKAIESLTGHSFEWLRTGEGKEHDLYMLLGRVQKGAEEPIVDTKYLQGKSIRPVTVTVNSQGKELTTLVGVRAQAGYLKGYGDPHYIEKLPAFNLPILKEGSYRMFEVDGDSMLQQGGGGLHDGDIVIAQYIEDIFTLKDRRVYVVISTEGVAVKRCINRLKDKDNPILICQSDNKNGQHPDIIVRPHEIIEVWELKAFISRQLGFATDLWDMLSNVEKQVALMNEKIKRIEEERAGGGF
ncbi:MAG TPA: S24 family peptidase [Chryseolinea sp.]|nr:S24 family peptidase [Chryseolinea sp.]